MLLFDDRIASRLGRHLETTNDIFHKLDNLFGCLKSSVAAAAADDAVECDNMTATIGRVLLDSLLIVKKPNVDQSETALCSDFTKFCAGREDQLKEKFDQLLISFFADKPLADVIRLACSTPDDLVPFVGQFVDEQLLTQLESFPKFSSKDQAFFTRILYHPDVESQLERWPDLKKIVAALLPPRPVHDDDNDLTSKTDVFVAAPSKKMLRLAVTGEDVKLGQWNRCCGSFKKLVAIDADIWIYRGSVPVPSVINSKFQFVFVRLFDDTKIFKYEGGKKAGERSRSNELLPDACEFFMFQEEEKKGWPAETCRKTVACFLTNGVVERVFEKRMDWDDAFDFVHSSVEKIRSIPCDSLEKCLDQVTGTLRLAEEEAGSGGGSETNRRLLVLCMICSKCAKFPQQISKILSDRDAEFARYLDGWLETNSVKRNGDKVDTLLRHLASVGDGAYSWLLFRLKGQQQQQENDLRLIGGKTKHLLSTLQRTPQLLLFNETVAGRVVHYLLNERRQPNGQLSSILKQLADVRNDAVSYRRVFDTAVLNQLTEITHDMDSAGAVLSCQLLASLFAAAPSYEGTFSDRLTTFLSQLFTRPKLADAVRLACAAPQYLAAEANKTVGQLAKNELQRSSTSNSARSLDPNDVAYFNGLLQPGGGQDRLAHLPAIRLQLENLLLREAVENAKGGHFDRIPTLNLKLSALMKIDVPFLKTASIAELQRSLAVLPRRFFQNLYDSIDCGRDTASLPPAGGDRRH